MGRMTLQGAVRFDNAWSYSPPQTIGPALIIGQTFLSTPLTFDETDGVNYKDISPRGGSALDVFGNGKTSVKINVGKYMDPASNSEQQLLDLQPDRAHRDDRRPARGPTFPGLGRPGSPATTFRSAISRTISKTASVPLRRRPRSERRLGPRPPSTPRSSTGGASVRGTGSSARRCSRSCCRASRWRSGTSSGGSRTSRPPTT